jgi:NitT/TauT family transport system permease protein
VLAALVDLVASGRIAGSLGLSLASLAAGFSLAVIVGIAAGVLMGRYAAAGRLFDPYLNALLAAPNLLFVPILFTLFGASRATQVGAVFLHAVFVIAATTQAGIREAPPGLIEMARSFGATERDLFWKIRLPEARPMMVAGLRIGVLYAVKGMINGEMFIALTGLGALIRTHGGRFEPDYVLAVIGVVIGVAVLSSALLDRGFRRPEGAA